MLDFPLEYYRYVYWAKKLFENTDKNIFTILILIIFNPNCKYNYIIIQYIQIVLIYENFKTNYILFLKYAILVWDKILSKFKKFLIKFQKQYLIHFFFHHYYYYYIGRCLLIIII